MSFTSPFEIHYLTEILKTSDSALIILFSANLWTLK